MVSGQEAADSTRDEHRRPGAALVDDDVGAHEDTDHPGAPVLQRKLSKIVNNSKIDGLMAQLAAEGLAHDTLRLHDLRDPHQDHGWSYALNSNIDVVLPEDERILAVRLRLGCYVVSGAYRCRCCGKSVLDRQVNLAMRCFMGESSRGRNSVCNERARRFFS